MMFSPELWTLNQNQKLMIDVFQPLRTRLLCRISLPLKNHHGWKNLVGNWLLSTFHDQVCLCRELPSIQSVWMFPHVLMYGGTDIYFYLHFALLLLQPTYVDSIYRNIVTSYIIIFHRELIYFLFQESAFVSVSSQTSWMSPVSLKVTSLSWLTLLLCFRLIFPELSAVP